MEEEFKVKKFKYEKYLKGVENVTPWDYECECCGAKVIFTTTTDLETMALLEQSICPTCGHKNHMYLHNVN